MLRKVATSAPHRGLAALVLPLALLLLLSWVGCGGTARSAYRDGQRADAREMWDHAVLSYAKAVAEEPGNERYRLALNRAKLRSSTVHFDRAKRYLQSQQWDMALKELQETVVLDPANQYALFELKRVNEEVERRKNQPSDMELAQTEAEKQAALLAPPKLDPRSNIPIVLKFPDSTVGEVYDTLSKTSGINFLYDEKVDLKKKTSIELANVSFEEAMDILMLMNKHFYKVIDGHTIMVVDDNRQKHTEYDDQVIRTFYLSNAETQEVSQLVRGLLETRRVADNKNLNAITIKDTPEKIKVAERIIKANDKAKGEVLLDIELLEINKSKIETLGFDLSSKSLSLVFGGASGTGNGSSSSTSLPLNQLGRLKQSGSWLLGPVPSVLLDFLRSDSDTKSIARPQIRILEGDTGKVMIGDRVPIPATSFNYSQTVGTNIVPITSFTYQNVGIQVEVKPRVHHNKEVTLDLKTEISALNGSIQGSGGSAQPIIGTRTVETTIRLQDGETNMLAGLIKEDEQKSLSGLPGIQDIPILRSLFGHHSTTTTRTDIVLSITPHIVRLPNIEPIDLVPLWVGTEDTVRLRGIARNALGESPFAAGANPWESIQQELKGAKTASGAQKDAKTSAAAAKTPGTTPATGGPTPATPKGPAAPTPALPTPSVQPASPAPQAAPPPDGAAAPPASQPAPPGAAGPTSPPGPVAQIQLVPDQREVPAGDPLAVDIVISDAAGVGAVNFQLRYDGEVIRFVPPATAGEFLSQGGAPIDLQAVESADGGLIVVSASRSGATGASGGGNLLRLNFVALQEGAANFSFAAAQLRGANNQSLPVNLRASDVSVTP